MIKQLNLSDMKISKYKIVKKNMSRLSLILSEIKIVSKINATKTIWFAAAFPSILGVFFRKVN